ncbi:arsenate reductase (glutaredoxin) [Arenibacter certesii]|uniref:Arsenate reductase (Glutaredoxin) n=1 Tax=Arenibacter certesii TaxID=228955 RepID=A0A918MIU6_9FLAO|nr:arsenate reductase (glutaredoxin) [Arenibacter certesii]GGW26129.1 arsenate reductase (glutaredoxin) [Arenibacter certesii]
MIKIFHNPRCSKSRQGVALLTESGKDFEIVKYLENVPTKKELKEIVKILGVKPIELIRTNESIWKDNYKGKELSDDELLSAMVENPKLIERPIVIRNNKGVIGRPPEKIMELL